MYQLIDLQIKWSDCLYTTLLAKSPVYLYKTDVCNEVIYASMLLNEMLQTCKDKASDFST